jgi:HSP20 family protein
MNRRNYDLFPAMIEEFFNRDLFQNNVGHQKFTPAVNILEEANGFGLELAVPGFKKEEIKMHLDGKVLTISAAHQNQTEQADAKYTRKEFSFQSFSRSFTLPLELIDADRIQAQYENGILKLELPKKEAEIKKGPKLIEIA